MSGTIRVAVLGALGKMGAQTVTAVCGDPELELLAAVDVGGARSQMACGSGIPVLAGVELLDPGEVDVAVDFTNAASAMRNARWALGGGVHAVIGTTGLSASDLEELAGLAQRSDANALVAPNFATGAVLMMRFCEMAARYFDQCEIVELHHRGKKDAPSGTALATAARVAEAMEAASVPPSQENEVRGTRGGAVGPVSIHSVRLDGLVAHQEVIFGSKGQTLTIRHDTSDRSCFMPGVLMAVKAVADLPGLTVGLEPILGL
ncbi:MAG: 4-hydroxy-tetrahydrodipicolinate reductase [Actinobacteria bacterium]|nr:4-hydroxy-tetrahydrodipicolinate reductase [Actinomycetota bacterium]MBU1944674.1 4-hydroxy-tetrahydrodipicolinate reductase [Actinomycetota bacterium]MBU2689222.1 4-hydroxy-tetrahydrodipicolinate reductase [Actinomycetota bacterium]